MSGPLAIAGVTAVLKDVLNNGLIDQDISSFVGSFTVTALPPDRITTGTQEPNQINLFLYKITNNQGWCNEALPWRDNNGSRLTNPPLAIDLHYLLSTYGTQDFNAEILLGHAMQVLHETPQISRKNIRIALGTPNPPVGAGLGGSVIPFPSPFGSLSAVDLADQIELIKITPQYLSTEELSKLWTAIQARYRQSMAYQVSVVLIQSKLPAKAALPVVKRGEQDRGADASANVSSIFPLLESVHIGPVEDEKVDPLPRSYPSMQLGLQLILHGQNFDGDEVNIRFNYKPVRSAESENSHPKFLPPQKIKIEPEKRSATRIQFNLPDDAAAMTDWRAGLYTVILLVTKDAKEHKSNEMPIVLAPRIDTIAPDPIVRGAGGDVTLTLTCSPTVISEQTAAILLADLEITADIRTSDTDPLVFVIKNAPAVTKVPIRLRIDGYDSMPFERKYDANGNPLPLAFTDNQKVTIP